MNIHRREKPQISHKEALYRNCFSTLL